VARHQYSGGGPSNAGRPAAIGWAKLTWDDLERWAGSGAVQRGRTYQRGGRVKDLEISQAGKLLATVEGSARYTTTVSLDTDRMTPWLESSCTCFVGFHCKHAVAAVAEYLAALADGRDIPLADEADPRWAILEGVGDEVGAERGEDEDDDPAGQPGQSGRSTAWDAKIEQYLRAKPRGELADLVWMMTCRYPEVYQEFRERLALAEGDSTRLIAEARQEIRRITAQPGWNRHYSNEGYTPDFSPIRHRLERLAELGCADEVVALGRDLLKRGISQVGESDDEGETLAGLASCLPVVFGALAASSLSGPKRLLTAIDAELGDSWGVVARADAVVFDAVTEPADWSAVADALIRRLEALPQPDDSEEAGFTDRYERDQLTDWIARALQTAGRAAERLPLFEAEARINQSYARLVDDLVATGQPEAAERWAAEGIARVGDEAPGDADHLAKAIDAIARQQKRWDIVAAHAARSFFDNPTPATFDALIQAAKQAKVEKPVRAAAQHFLETGIGPFLVLQPPPAPTPPPRPASSRSGRRRSPSLPDPTPPAEPRAGLAIDEKWPLPLPDYFVSLLTRPRRYRDPAPRPHLDVLLEMALAAGKAEDILHWFDKLRVASERPGSWGRATSFIDRVATAVVSTHPERAIEFYRAGLDESLVPAHQSSYEAAINFLKKLRPIYDGLGRVAEWTVLVASTREANKRRRRFIELLDQLAARPIVESPQSKRK